MDKKRYLAYAVVAAILAILIYVQFRTWKNFDWPPSGINRDRSAC